MKRYRSIGLRPALPSVTLDYLAHGAAKGGRNAALFDAACQFRDAGFSQPEAESQLMQRALADKLSQSEALQSIRSAFGHPQREAITHAAPERAQAPATARYRRASRSEAQLAPMPLPEALQDGFQRLLAACFKEGEHVAVAPAKENESGDIVPTRGVTMTREE